MEFLILSSGDKGQLKREITVMKAVIKAAEKTGADLITKRRGNVYSTGVYLKNGSNKSLVYIDWGKNWTSKKICNSIISSIKICNHN